ncbi:MAG: hypothetical protein KC708_21935 [Anaerolineae bacterium]|nr:hypothetical protein [Anaerolineae bacterium]
MSLAFQSRLTQVVLGLLVVILLVQFVIYLAFAAELIPFPFDYDQGEGHELYNAVLFSEGKCPYCTYEDYPYYSSNYPPVFHLIMMPLVAIFGPQYWIGRTIIFVSTLITGGSIAWAIFRKWHLGTVAAIAALSFFASNFIYHLGPLLRQHLLMVMFETLAVVILANAFDLAKPLRRRHLLIGFTLLLVAGYTKQLAYSTCIAVGLWALLRNPRIAIVYSLGLIAAAVGIFAVAEISTNGYWSLNLIAANRNPFIPEQYSGLLRQFVMLHWPLLILSAVSILYELFFDRLSLFSLWFVVSFASTIASGTWGAGDSYFATTIVSACILSGNTLALLVTKRGSLVPRLKPVGNLGLVAVVALLFVYSLRVIKLPTSGPIFGPIAAALGVEPAPGHRYPLYDAAGWTVGYAVTGHFPSAEDYANGWYIVERIEESGLPAMTEDPGFMMRAGQDVVTNATQLNNLYVNGLYDPVQLVADIQAHRFGVIVLRARFYPQPVLDAIDSAYMLDEIVPMNGFNYELWVPKA